MAQKPSTSRERIIPIQIEGREEPVKIKDEPPVKPEKEKVEESSLTETDIETSKESIDEIKIERSLPPCNAKEKIILVVDSAEDENVTHFKLNNTTHKPLSMIKRAVEFFIQSKHLINPKHEYALILLNESSAVWVQDFTNNIKEVIETLQNIGNCDAEDIFDLNSLFEVISEHVEIPGENEVEEILMPPPYVVRTILFYARSYTLPKIHESPEVQKLVDSPYFTFDVLMTHEPVDIDNNCNKIFNILQNVDKKGFSYFFPVCRDVKTLHESIGKLLAHPLQRPIQKLANYTLKELEV